MTQNSQSSYHQKPTHKQSKPASQVYSINQKVYIIPLKTNGIVKEYDDSKNLYLITYFVKNNKNNTDNKNKKDKRLTKWFTFDQISDNIKTKPLNKNEIVISPMTEEGRKIVGDFIKQHKVEIHQDQIIYTKEEIDKLKGVAEMEQKSIDDYLKEIKQTLPQNVGVLTTPEEVYSEKYVNDLKEQIEHYKTLYLEYKNLYENQKTVNYINNKKETK